MCIITVPETVNVNTCIILTDLALPAFLQRGEQQYSNATSVNFLDTYMLYFTVVVIIYVDARVPQDMFGRSEDNLESRFSPSTYGIQGPNPGCKAFRATLPVAVLLGILPAV